jgi:hypothetical protein
LSFSDSIGREAVVEEEAEEVFCRLLESSNSSISSRTDNKLEEKRRKNNERE